MTTTHLPTGHPEIEADRYPPQSVHGSHVTHHRLGGLDLAAWTHTSVTTDEHHHKATASVFGNTRPATVTAQYVPAKDWAEDVEPFVSVRVAVNEEHRGLGEVCAYLTPDLAAQLRDALTIALAEHDLS